MDGVTVFTCGWKEEVLMGYGTNFGNKISASMVLFAYVWVIANWPRSTIILLYIIFGLLAWLIYRLIIYPLAALLEGLLILIESKMCWHRRSIKQEVSEQLLWPNSWVNGIGDNQPPLRRFKGHHQPAVIKRNKKTFYFNPKTSIYTSPVDHSNSSCFLGKFQEKN